MRTILVARGSVSHPHRVKVLRVGCFTFLAYGIGLDQRQVCIAMQFIMNQRELDEAIVQGNKRRKTHPELLIVR